MKPLTQEMATELSIGFDKFKEGIQHFEKVLAWIKEGPPTGLLYDLKATRLQRSNWSLRVSAGFVAEDIESVHAEANKDTVTIKMKEEKLAKTWRIFELNLRELDELIKRVEQLCA